MLSDAEQSDMHLQNNLDADLNVPFAPSVSDLLGLVRTNLAGWLAYVRNEPSLPDLRTKAHDIMEAIQAASGLEGAEQLAIELALAVDSQFGRLGLGRSWYPRLMSLYGPAIDRADALAQSQLYQCLIRHYLHHGDLLRAGQVINTLLDIAEQEPDVPVQEAMLGAASLAASLATNEDSIVLAEQLLSLANLTGDYFLMARTYTVLSQFFSNSGNPARTFEYGQMAFVLSTYLADPRYTVVGLHYMAIAFEFSGTPRRAFPYLEQATSLATHVGDSSQLDFLWHTWGSCLYLGGDYSRAEPYLEKCVAAMQDRGTYRAAAVYMLGLCQMQLGRLDEASQSIEEASGIWTSLNRSFDQLCAEHALAEIYWRQKNRSKAIQFAEQALRAAKQVSHSRRDALIQAIQDDLRKYHGSQCNRSSAALIDYGQPEDLGR